LPKSFVLPFDDEFVAIVRRNADIDKGFSIQKKRLGKEKKCIIRKNRSRNWYDDAPIKRGV